MSYFSLNDHQALTYNTANADMQLVYDKFQVLHKTLHRRLHDHNYDLHPHWQPSTLISNRSATCLGCSDAMTLPYFRSREQAQRVERLMGRDHQEWHTDVEIYRHPVIELRLTPKHFAVELVLGPNAWWDQQNFVGKLGIQRHRDTFRGILQRMDGDFHFGFWDGPELSDMHLTTRQLARSSYLHEWMSTFADGQDWLRLGMWYQPEEPMLATERIASELSQRIGMLYNVYNFLLWTSNNDFHSFYQRSAVKPSTQHYT